MLFLKYFLTTTGGGLVAAAAALVFFDLYRLWRGINLPAEAGVPVAIPSIRWRHAAKLAALGCLPALLGLSIVVVPAGSAGVLVSQISGTRPGVFYPGIHYVVPLVQNVVLYDMRDQVYNTVASEDPKKKADTLKVQTKEGLSVGLAVTVRYRLDPRRLDSIHNNLPQDAGDAVVPPVVSGAFRQVVPNYLVREVFAARREEVRNLSTRAIEQKLAGDGILVKEVILRDILLPAEYAKGMEGLLLKEQENERLTFEVEIKQKMVRTAELEAEADKARKVKQAEGDAQVVVLNAKAQADAMQHTLPLKQKQIEQSRLEAQARKESTVKNAEALAEAKVIDSRAELERRNLMTDAEANRIRITAAADAEKLKGEAVALRQNPLLIQKIIAERLSDKVQVMMVPTDGKFFFANDVLRGAQATAPAPDEAEDLPPAQAAVSRRPAR